MKKKFIVKQEKVNDFLSKDYKERYATFICTFNLNEVVIPHPISVFIDISYGHLSLNSQKRYAEELKKFLNFIIERISEEDDLFSALKFNGLSELKIEHGAEYLKLLSARVKSKEIQPNSFYFIEKLLINFYYWLSSLDIISNKIEIKTKSVIVNNQRFETHRVETLVSPFKRLDLGVSRPKRNTRNNLKKRLHDFGAGNLELVNLFLRVAELNEPDIAFGIALQCYGGLRLGEVLNLKKDSVKEEEYSEYKPLLVDVFDRWEELYPNSSNLNGEQVKFVREQIIFRVEIVDELYKKHMKRISNNSSKIKSDALLISKNGKPIRAQTYRSKFNKVKEKFLETVLSNSISDYKYLTSKPWSTHIGRGIFTNILVCNLKLLPSEVALYRGDKSLNSASYYVEENNLILRTKSAINELESMIKKTKVDWLEE